MFPLQLRKAVKGDVPFIANSWLKSYRSSDAVRGIANRSYHYYHHRIMEELIPHSVLVVLSSEEDPDQIVGWMCYEKTDNSILMHYIYVKFAFRRMGLAKKMVAYVQSVEDTQAIVFTHRTHNVRDWLRAEGWTYNPYLLYGLISPIRRESDSRNRIRGAYAQPTVGELEEQPGEAISQRPEADDSGGAGVHYPPLGEDGDPCSEGEASLD